MRIASTAMPFSTHVIVHLVAHRRSTKDVPGWNATMVANGCCRAPSGQWCVIETSVPTMSKRDQDTTRCDSLDVDATRC